MKFSIKDFFRRNLRIWSHLLKKSLIITHGFNDTINPMCICGIEVETTEHCL